MPERQVSASVESRPSPEQDVAASKAPEEGRNFGPIGGFEPSDGQDGVSVADEDKGAKAVPPKTHS